MKISNLIKKIQCSTLIKLLFVIIITGIIVILLVGGFLKYYSSQLYLPFIKNISHYTNYIIREIGTPPDILKALEIAQDLSLHIRFESSNLQWTTDDKLISFKEFDKLTSDENEQIKTDIEEGIYFVAVNQDLGRYLFAFDFKKSTHDKEVLVTLMFILLTLVFLFAYLSIRWILKPIKWLTEGVKQVSKGNLNFQIPIRKMDDLGELTESFNSMTRRIAEMIHAKEQLLLDVSHEIRSPLTRIKVALEFVPDGNTKKSIGEDLLEVEKMIMEILETERLDSDHGKIHLKKVDVLGIIKEVLQDFQNKSPGIKLTSLLESIFLNVDTDRIKTVLKNVIENSLKYSKSESQPIEISIDEEEKSVVIRIKDHGSGIPKEELPYIFEPFYRIDKSRSKETGGYGLGMSLCKKIMEAHGGTIEISSELNIGTTVILRFEK